MSDASDNMIVGKEIIISELGYWPELCDAKILELKFRTQKRSRKNLSILLHYIDMDKKIDANIKITLGDVSNIELNDLRMENVIDRIDINNLNGQIEFKIEASAGVFGFCTCKTANIRLVSLRGYQEAQ